MLTLSFHRCHRRRTAWVTLLAWVLALMAGMVNACQLQTRDAARPGPANVDLHDSGVHADPASHAGHVVQDRGVPASDAGKAGCLKFCDEGASTLAKGQVGHDELAAPVVVAILERRVALTAPSAAFKRATSRPRAHGPPLVIRFLHLTL
ncbi:MAG: hypothetical protein IPG91_03285 [Ideonella sp.]|nr:hypothetical protein [Ideonella sp.]